MHSFGITCLCARQEQLIAATVQAQMEVFISMVMMCDRFLSCLFCIHQVSSYVGDSELEGCLKGCELVVIPAGVPRKPGMTRDDLFNINAGIVMNLVGAVAKYCPEV